MKTNRNIPTKNKIIYHFNRIGFVLLLFVMIQILIFSEQNASAQVKRQGLFNINKQTNAKTKNNGANTSTHQSFDDLSKASTSRENANEAIRKIPWNSLDSKSREKIESLVRDHTIYRRLPMSGGFCNPEMFDFLLCHPDVVVALWEVLGYAQISLQEVSPNNYYLKESAGTAGHVKILYQDNELMIAHCNGVYRGPLIPRPLEGEIIIILQVRYTEDPKHEPIVICRMDSFIRVKNVGVDLMGRVFQPLIGKVADMNFEQTIDFVNGVSKTAEENPDQIQDLIQQTTKISAETKQKFLQTTERVSNQYYSRANGEIISYQLQSKQNQPLGGNARVLSREGNQPISGTVSQNERAKNQYKPTNNKPEINKSDNSQSQQHISVNPKTGRSSSGNPQQLTSPNSFAPSSLSNQDVFDVIDFSLANSDNQTPLTQTIPESSKGMNVVDKKAISSIPSLSVKQINQNQVVTTPKQSLIDASNLNEKPIAKPAESKFINHRPSPLSLSNNSPLSNRFNNPKPLQIQETKESQTEENLDVSKDNIVLKEQETDDYAKEPTVLLHQFNKEARPFGSSSVLSVAAVPKASPLNSSSPVPVFPLPSEKIDQEEDSSEFMLALPPLENVTDNNINNDNVDNELPASTEEPLDIQQKQFLQDNGNSKNQWKVRVSTARPIQPTQKESQQSSVKGVPESEDQWTPVHSTTSNLAMRTNDSSGTENAVSSDSKALKQNLNVKSNIPATEIKENVPNSSQSPIFKKPVLR